jgi:carbon-monoxide dehydrogenase medium subunit
VTAGFALRRPTSVAEAVDELASGGVAYCGGTELVAVLRLGLIAPERLVDLKRVAGLEGITEAGDDIVLGARVTHDEAEQSPAVRQHAPVLAAATAQLGNARVRATGTLAGNVCFAEPRSDIVTALIALRADVVLLSAAGTRTVPVDEFVEGAFTTTRADDELLESIRIPRRQGRSAYVRFQPAEYPAVTVAATEDADGCRVVVGAVGERPDVFTFPSVADVDVVAIAESVDVTEDLTGREDYKRHLTGVFVRRAIAQLQQGAA